MWNLCRAILGALLLCVCQLAQAQTLITLDPSSTEQSLPGRMEWLEDKSASLTVDQVSKATVWHVLRAMPNMGYTHSAIWVRLRLEQPIGGVDWILSVDDTQIDWIEFYLPQLEGGWALQRAGRSVDRHDWPRKSRTPALSIQLPSGQHDVYLRLRSQHAGTYPLRLQTTEGFVQQRGRDALLYGIYFGIFLTALMLQVFFWLATREALSFWYVIYSSMILTLTSLTTGYPQLMLDAYQPSSQLMGVLITLAPLLVVRMTAVWLDLRSHPYGDGAQRAGGQCQCALQHRQGDDRLRQGQSG